MNRLGKDQENELEDGCGSVEAERRKVMMRKTSLNRQFSRFAFGSKRSSYFFDFGFGVRGGLSAAPVCLGEATVSRETGRDRMKRKGQRTWCHRRERSRPAAYTTTTYIPYYNIVYTVREL